jgi:hypothetical protein
MKTVDSENPRIYKFDKKLTDDPFNENYQVLIHERERYIRNVGRQRYEEIELKVLPDLYNNKYDSKVMVPVPKSRQVQKLIDTERDSKRSTFDSANRRANFPMRLYPVPAASSQPPSRAQPRRQKTTRRRVKGVLDRLYPDYTY